jgi:rubrerythrin/rhodanese-related sulfurtransferase
MIQLKKLFTPVDAMEAEEARAYIAAHPEGTYVLLDVRQPWEYEEAHLPGAKLMPLPRLPEAYKELDPEKPTIVHCAVGGRSRVAAQMLSGLGFKEVYNLAGGIKAYQGLIATGPQELNLDLVRGDESPAEIIALAYGMEKALQTFYDTMAARAEDAGLKELLTRLARVEERHKQSLAEVYVQVGPIGGDTAALEALAGTEIMEGGFKFQEFMARNSSRMQTVPEVLELALMLETQALDLYLRLGDRCAQVSTKEVLLRIAEEEKAHLAALGRLLDEVGAKARV